MGLSEPRKRVKYSIDPNALRWSNDDSKFGKRLMEKMGWQSGTGLGAKSNGMTENIKVKFKSDTKGVGYNNNDYDNVWLDHQDDFESVLSELNKATANKTEEKVEKPAINSLEQKSKDRAKRLHYSKFARSKDLSMASQNDLACILGTDKRTKKTKTNEEDDNSDDKSNLCFANNSFMEPIKKTENKKVQVEKKEDNLLFKTNSMSISDYFAQKMKNKLNKTDDIEPEVEQEVEIKESKKRKKSKDKEEVVEQLEEVEIEHKKKKKKNKNTELVQVETKVEIEVKQKNGREALFQDAILSDKSKRADKKRQLVDKNLEKDPKFYEMKKKPTSAL